MSKPFVAILMGLDSDLPTMLPVMALGGTSLDARVKADRQMQAEAVIAKDAALQARLSS